LSKSAEITLRAEIGELERLQSWLESLRGLYQLPDRVAFQLDLCLTELVTNVINYGYPAGQPPVDAVAVRLTRHCADLRIEISDRGIEFDPVAYVPRAAARSLEEARAGGRGLLLVRKFATQLQHRRVQGTNRLSFIIPAPPDAVC
jgi:anti-sigma regulatory factor (Ser/Thr protein kinase)